MARRGQTMTWKTLGATCFAVVAASWAYVGAGAPLWPGTGEAIPLTAEVVIGDIEQAIVVNGTLEPTQMVNVGAQVSGQIKTLSVVLGQQVKAGDPIAEIDSVPQQNALRLAEANLASATAQRDARAASLKQAQSGFERQKGLLESDATTGTDFEAAEAAYKSAVAEVAALDAQIERSEVEVEIARANLAYTRITAPIDGTIIAVVTKQGQTLNASNVTPTIVVIAQLDVMSVKVQISEAEIGKVKVGQEVWFTLLDGSQTRYDATLEIIEPAPQSLLSQTTDTTQTQGAAVYFNGIFKVANVKGALRPLMTAQVHLITGRANGIPTVLSSSLGERQPDGRYRVEKLTAAGPQATLVTVGLDDKANAQILEGLAAGDRVILPLGEAVDAPDMSGGMM